MARFAAKVVIAIAILVTAIAVVAAPWNGAFHADPTVQVIMVGSASGAAGTLDLVNDSAATIEVGAIVTAQACSNITVSPATAFTVISGARQPLTLACATQPAGIHVCPYDVRAPGGEVLTGFEAACHSIGSPTLTPSPLTLAFGDVAIGAPETLSLAILNTGALDQTVQRLDLLITDREHFEIGTPCNQPGHFCSSNVTLAAGAMTNVAVRCTPKSTGLKTAQLYIASDSLQHLPSPVTVSCNGTAGTAPVISVSPTSLDLGSVEAAQGTATGTLHVANVGTGDLTITDVRAVDSGTGAALDWTYVASAPCAGQLPPPCVLAANARVALAITFDPSKIAVREATLLVSYHDTADRSMSIPLAGTGTGVTLELVGPTLLDFGRVPVGFASSVTVQIANRGNRVLDNVVSEVSPGPFTVMPAMTTVSHTAPRSITLTCTPTQVGVAMATVTTSAPDAPGDPLAIMVTCEGSDQALHARPSTILLGEVRTGSAPVTVPIDLLSTGAALTIASSTLTPNPNLTLGAVAPTTTPTLVPLTITPSEDGDLANHVDITATNGDALHIPIAGKVVTASVATPLVMALGTFCINQPTSGATLELRASGTGSVGLPLAPSLAAAAASPYELALAEPSTYPTSLAPLTTATIELTPRRQIAASTLTDRLVWTTDVAGQELVETTVSARFIADEGAIAPSTIGFGRVQASHLIRPNGRLVTIQNCGIIPLELAAIIPTPFAIEGASIPTILQPGETARVSVGFHPTQVGVYHDFLTIESNQLSSPLEVELSGEGIPGGGAGDADPEPRVTPTSFYACSCRTADPGSALALGLVLLGVLRRRRPSRPR